MKEQSWRLVSFRATPAEIEIIKKNATANRLTLSEYLRNLGLAGVSFEPRRIKVGGLASVDVKAFRAPREHHEHRKAS